MAKRRQIHPEIWTDEKFVSLDPLARLLFIGMWNHACDNGHLDDSALQLKMRVLPADSCDVPELLDQIVESGMVTREDGYLKVTNLSQKQALDMRYLVFCDHCEEDPARRYTEEDRPARKGQPKGSPTSAPRAPDVRPTSAPSSGVGDGVGDGDVLVPAGKPTVRGTRVPHDFSVTDDMRSWAREKSLDYLDLDTITESFVDYWQARAGKDATKTDWVATWRNWIRRESTNIRPMVRSESRDERPARNLARLPKCPTCNAPQEITHYEDCTDTAWRPTA